ncbi:MAG TPA: hypothetical protein VLT33_41700 [Labilithrix sp.]|nr:hypothetical protein [Labilithrix sp.]
MSGTPSLRWEWTLANGARVAAEIDKAKSVERVLVGGRVASEAARGTKADGHSVVAPPQPSARTPEPLTAVLSFEANAPICILRVDGFEVAPTTWPQPQRKAVQPQEVHPLARWLILAAVAVAVIGVAVALIRRSRSASSEQALASTLRSSNGLFIAHYPASFKTRPVVLPSPLAGALLEDDEAHETIVLAAFELEATTAPDRWLLQQRFHDEILSNVPKAARSYVEVERRDDRCLGEAGAVVLGRFERPDGARARVWSCAFVKDRRGYIASYVLPETAPDARLRRIVDGTELTQLESVGTP